MTDLELQLQGALAVLEPVQAGHFLSQLIAVLLAVEQLLLQAAVLTLQHAVTLCQLWVHQLDHCYSDLQQKNHKGANIEM